MNINVDEIKEIEKRLKPVLKKTELIYSNYFSEIFNANIYLNPENLQRTGSFKIRERIIGFQDFQKKN